MNYYNTTSRKCITEVACNDFSSVSLLIQIFYNWGLHFQRVPCPRSKIVGKTPYYEVRPQSKFLWDRLHKQNPIYWNRYTYFSTYSTSRIETFVIPWDNFCIPMSWKSTAWDWKTCVTLISASLSFWKPWRWPGKEFLQVLENTKIIGREVQAIRWTFKYLPTEYLQEPWVAELYRTAR